MWPVHPETFDPATGGRKCDSRLSIANSGASHYWIHRLDKQGVADSLSELHNHGVRESAPGRCNEAVLCACAEWLTGATHPPSIREFARQPPIPQLSFSNEGDWRRHGTVLSKPPGRSQQSKQKEVAAAKSAPAGQKEPVESLLKGISSAYASKVDRPAMWTVWGEHGVT